MNPSEHPDFDALADLDAGLLPGGEAARLRAHVGDCAECQAASRALSDTTAALRAAPPVTMPDDVAQRLDRALAADPGSAQDVAAASATVTPTVVPIRRRRRLGSGAGLAGAAAAAAVVLLVAGVVAGALRSTHHDTKAGAARTSAASGGGVERYIESTSNRDYTPATLRTGVAQLLGQPATKEAHPSDAAQGSAGSPASAPAPEGPLAEGLTTSSLSRLRGQPLALFDCIAALTGQAAPATVPLAVDFARFNGGPAAIIVLPTPGNPVKADVWVVGPGCSSKDDQTRYFIRISR